MKLFYAPTSPYVRKVMAVAHEAGLADKIELLFSGTTPLVGDKDLRPVNRDPRDAVGSFVQNNRHVASLPECLSRDPAGYEPGS